MGSPLILGFELDRSVREIWGQVFFEKEDELEADFH